MDFRSATAQPQPNHQTVGTPSVNRHSKDEGAAKWLRWASVALLFCITILIVAVIGILASNTSSGNDQSKYVDTSKYQAVFLTNGQVYFGNITNISGDYLRLTNIYYLTQNTTTDAKGNVTTNGNYTLVKLGCQQIHDPVDEMIVERAQVSFWENLQNSGKVVTSINQFKKQNPNGPDCSQVSNQTQASNSNSSATQGTGTTNNSSTTNP